ncbi:uncharacterized protein [Apostichopus japonicus]|uniref:uncharacterized protein isoform X1 n=1 Tax=Stichopus japonicus TaxID=307972 RepID=UPI003AB77110
MSERNQLAHLVGLGYTNKIIAEMMGVSVKSVKNLRKSFNLRKKDICGQVTDPQLDEMVTAALTRNPNYGEKMVHGLLASKGIKVQRQRLRQSLRRVDPQGVERRKATTLHRRQYHVEGPNSVWHIDGNHKLIRWRFVIHGGIDGYSRISVFLRCASNNRAETMLSSFQRGVLDFGLPAKVRSDKGGENVLVCSFMMNHPLRGPESKPFITGRSVHNQRIERLWRDVFTGCASTYYTLFSKLEDDGQLDIADDIDLMALHLVFLPIINDHLGIFQRSHMHHKIRTANNKTPLQLYHTAIDEGYHVDVISEEEMEHYRHQDAGFVADAVNVPNGIQLTEDQQAAFTREFNLDVSALRLEQDQISYFVAAKDFLHNILNN